MLVTFTRRPNTVILCLLWSILAAFFIFFDINAFLRIIFSIPIIIFIPGYLLLSALFPEKTDSGLDVVDRIALAVGISIAIVPLVGIVLFYSPWGLTLQPIIASLEILILSIGAIAIIRWLHTPSEKRYTPTVNLSLPPHETKYDTLLSAILVVCLVITASLIIYVILTPKQEEHFTDFYILGSNHLAYNYPVNLTSNHNATIILGVVNHENTPMNYTIEVWLSNQTTKLNTSSMRNDTIYHHLWFMDKINITLPNQPINLEEMKTTQWEYNYTIHIDKTGKYKVVFLLYITPTPTYSKTQDYRTIATEKVDSDHTTAYRNLYLWINVQ